MVNEKGIIGKITEGFAESTRAVREINKENMAAIKADSKANFEEVTTPDPGFEKFKQAKGLRNKAKVIAENIKDGAKENTIKEQERRTEIQSHESYRTLLEEQREQRQKTIKQNKEKE